MRQKNTISIMLVLIAFIFPLQVSKAAEKESGCVTCHKELSDELKKPTEIFATDIHSQKGLGCNDCHGGNPNSDDITVAKDATFKGKPAFTEVPDFCGKCHANAQFIKQYNPTLPTDQLEKYYTSLHGQKIKEGDVNVANCVSCHSVHDILPATEPKSTVYPTNVPATCARCHADAAHMKPYGIPTDQYEEFKGSVHGIALLKEKDLGAPACNACHGNHAANPPEVQKIGYVCGRCHVIESDLFEKSPHRPAFETMGFPFCKTCHGDHDIQHFTNDKLGSADQSVCITCHQKDDGTKGIETADYMKKSLDDLEIKMNEIKSIIDISSNRGIDVEPMQLKMRDVNQVLVLSKTEIHSFNLEIFKPAIDKGFTTVAEVDTLAKKAIKEFRTRRQGYALATLALTFLCIFIYMKIREVDKKLK